MRGKTTKGLILFKQHFSESCPTRTNKRLSPSAKRFFFNCQCPFWIMGRLPTGEKIPRESTRVTTFAEAEAIRDSFLHERARGAQKQAASGFTIAECVETYLAARADELSDKTARQTRLALGRLQSFCEARGVIHMRGLTVDLLERFKVEGLSSLVSTSKSTSMAKLRRFLREAQRRSWIKEPLAFMIKTTAAVYEPAEPYTDEEVDKILSAVESLESDTHGYAGNPKTFRLLLELTLDTGMRIGDAIRFNPSALMKGKTFWVYTYYPQKQRKAARKKVAEVFITDRLKKAIDNCDWMTPGKRPFFYKTAAETGNPAYLANEVYARLQTIGLRAGIEDCRPHRFRDTFAVRCLLRGMALEDVSRLLSHSSTRVTEMHYAKWVTARKLRLERVLAEAMVHPQSDAFGD